MKRKTVEALLERFGKRYSEVLGIDLDSGKDEEIFNWFLASVLFGAPITETSVIKTYKCFEKYEVLTLEARAFLHISKINLTGSQRGKGITQAEALEQLVVEDLELLEKGEERRLEIAKAHGVPITREEYEKKEKKLLRKTRKKT